MLPNDDYEPPKYKVYCTSCGSFCGFTDNKTKHHKKCSHGCGAALVVSPTIPPLPNPHFVHVIVDEIGRDRLGEFRAITPWRNRLTLRQRLKSLHDL